MMFGPKYTRETVPPDSYLRRACIRYRRPGRWEREVTMGQGLSVVGNRPGL